MIANLALWLRHQALNCETANSSPALGTEPVYKAGKYLKMK